MSALQRASLSGLWLIAAVAIMQGCQTPFDRHPQYQLNEPRQPNQAVASGSGGSSRISVPDPEARALLSLDEDAELADYLAYAAANSPALRAAFHRWVATVERIPQVTSLPDPMLGYGYFLEDFTARRAMEQHVFEISQTFPWFGKLKLRGDAASLAADAAAHEYEGVRLALFLDIRRAYYELYQLGREIEITQDNLSLLQQFESVARAQFRVGGAAHADVVRAQVELGRMEDRLRQLEQLRRPAAARFNAVLGRAADAPVVWPSQIAAERLDTDATQLEIHLARANPRLLALETEVERGRIQSDLARRDFYPDVTLGGMYALRGDDPLLVSAMINVPIWRGRYEAAVREARAGRITAAYSRKDQQNRLSADLHEALFDHDDAQRRIDLYRNTLLPKARESLQASLAGFQGGTTTFLALLDAERTLLEFELAASRADTDRAIALARLDALVGQPVPRTSAAPVDSPEDQPGLETQP